MQVSLNFRIRCGFDVKWRHFLFVFIKVSQLFFHILILYPFFFLCNVWLLLIFNIFVSKLFIFEESFILFHWLILFRLSVFRFHFDNFRHGIKGCSGSSEVRLVLYPLKYINYAFPLVQIYFFNHTGSLFHFKQLKIVNYILYIESLLFFKQHNQWNVFKLSSRIQNIEQELFFFI